MKSRIKLDDFTFGIKNTAQTESSNIIAIKKKNKTTTTHKQKMLCF